MDWIRGINLVWAAVGFSLGWTAALVFVIALEAWTRRRTVTWDDVEARGLRRIEPPA